MRDPGLQNEQESRPEGDWGPLSALPGNPLMWVLILSEMLVFAAFFTVFAWQRAGEREVFDASQQLLNPVLGSLNTMVLLTSGLCAALALIASGYLVARFAG